MTKIRTPTDRDRLTLALVAPDEAFRATEKKWGQGRLERCVSQKTLESYRRGWTAYREAIETGDAGGVEQIGPKMVAALKFMDAEAERLGHKPLSVDAWEVPFGDGKVLVIVRTQAEAHAAATDKTDTRDRVIYTMTEIANVLATYEQLTAIKLAFPGAEAKGPIVREGEPVKSGVQMTEYQVSDWATQDPIGEQLAVYA